MATKLNRMTQQNSDRTAPSSTELYHLQFSLPAARPKTFGYTLVLCGLSIPVWNWKWTHYFQDVKSYFATWHFSFRNIQCGTSSFTTSQARITANTGYGVKKKGLWVVPVLEYQTCKLACVLTKWHVLLYPSKQALCNPRQHKFPN